MIKHRLVWIVPLGLLIFLGLCSLVFFSVGLPQARGDALAAAKQDLRAQTKGLKARLSEDLTSGASDGAAQTLYFEALRADFRGAYLVDDEGTILLTHRSRLQGVQIMGLDSRLDIKRLQTSLESGQILIDRSAARDTLLISYSPLLAPDEIDGDVSYGLILLNDVSATADQAVAHVKRAAFAVAAAAVIGAASLAVLVHVILGARLKSLVATAEHWSAGKTTARSSVTGPDELGRIGDVLNHLAMTSERLDADLLALRDLKDQRDAAHRELLSALMHEGEALMMAGNTAHRGNLAVILKDLQAAFTPPPQKTDQPLGPLLGLSEMLTDVQQCLQPVAEAAPISLTVGQPLTDTKNEIIGADTVQSLVRMLALAAVRRSDGTGVHIGAAQTESGGTAITVEYCGAALPLSLREKLFSAADLTPQDILGAGAGALYLLAAHLVALQQGTKIQIKRGTGAATLITVTLAR